MSDLASVIGALSTSGLEAYAVSNGAPIGISTVGGVGVASVGTNATANAYLPYILIAAAAAVLYFLLK